ncbi:hypothetical protein [Flavobacterium wongokense]|uniref:hypothetical protein n=1 Tax=Flavobacterium wongokense TaxID=2910674 RepID=UPI001F244092|nr:hypothetical protein [Flavobacterium sp. WG47]MCF6130951.1 hypothetical protein [Flavobacterium sp. WG47]
MENRKDIGKAINDKLSSLDKTPREQVWVGINEELQKKKKRRFVFFFFWTKVIGLLLVGALAAFYVYRYNDGFNFGLPNDSNKSIIENGSNKNLNGDGINAPKNISDIESSTTNDTHSNINNGIAVDGKNTIENSNDVNNNSKNILNKKNSSKNGNLVNTKNNSTSIKAGIRNNSVGLSSKSGKAKSKLYSKADKRKSGKKSKDNKINNAKDDLALLETNLIKKDSAIVDLASLKGKKTHESILEAKSKKRDSLAELKTKKRDSIAELKAKKRDSIAAQKEKDLTKNINMYKKEKEDSIPVLSYKKFDFDVYVSPTFYGYFGETSSLDRRLDSLPKKSEVKFSYGVGLTYDMTKKLSFRIGYSKVNISYVTQNAPINVPNYSGIGYSPNLSNETIFSASNGSETMDITQQISYTEIPFEFKYKFMDRKIGLKSSVGFSFFLLDKNSISIKTLNGFSQEIGKTKTLSDNGMSVNLGVEADYPLFKNMKIFVEPTFNYQIKSFSNSDVKSYYFGIHTGLRYSFNN